MTYVWGDVIGWQVMEGTYVTPHTAMLQVLVVATSGAGFSFESF